MSATPQHIAIPEIVTINGSDVRWAWDAIASQDPGLLPADQLPVMGSKILTLSDEPHVSEGVTIGDAVEWHSGLEFTDLPPDNSTHPNAGNRLLVRGAAQCALRDGLEGFMRGPDKSDFTHLRLRRVLTAMRRRHAAKRILPLLPLKVPNP